MSDAFLAEIRLVPFTFAPKGWALCQGQLLPITQNTALFSLLGTTYGGDGRSTFALPNLQGVTVMGAGQGAGLSEYFLGETGGTESVQLNSAEMPVHTHGMLVSPAPGTTSSPSGTSFAMPRVGRTPEAAYGTEPTATLSPQALAAAGSSLPHDNMQPYLVLNYIIAMQGIFPPRS